MIKNKLLAFAISAMTIFSCITNAIASPDKVFIENEALEAPEIQSEAALLADLNTGRILYSKNSQKKIYPASTTKILTAIIALEYGELDDVLTASVSALSPITNEDSHMGLLIGEQLTLEQLLYGMMIYSANDASNVIAEYIGGTTENFVEIMNQELEEIGAENTHFSNAYGIHDQNHYTTAEDMLKITRYAMQNETFREIVDTEIYKIAPTEQYPNERVLPNTNLFVGSYRSTEFFDPNVTGIKTGSTSDAGHCLVTSALKDETELVTLVFKAPDKNTSYTDSKALLDLGFANYTQTTIASPDTIVLDSKVYEAKDDTRVALTVDSEVKALLPKDTNVQEAVTSEHSLPKQIKSPIKKGDPIATITYKYNGNEIGTANLIAANDVERNNLLFLYHIVFNITTHPLFIIPAILIILLLIIRHINVKQQKKLERKRRIQNAQKKLDSKRPPQSPEATRYAKFDGPRNSTSRYKR